MFQSERRLQNATFKVTKINFRLHSDARSQQQVALTTEMLPCDWLIKNLYKWVIKQLYLTKWPMSVYLLINVAKQTI